MKKRIVMISMALAASSILCLIARDPGPVLPADYPEETIRADYPETVRIRMSVKEWMDPVQSPQRGKEKELEFNEVRVVCIPAEAARMGAAQATKTIGAHKTFPSPRGQHYCYAKFFYNPAKPAQARMICGGRTRQAESDYAFSTINQLPCWVTYLDNSENIKDKVENPFNYTQYASSIPEAIYYLKTGLLPISK